MPKPQPSSVTVEPQSPFAHHRFSVAPMMDWTDRHCRFFHRTLSTHARLYTEMLTTGALIHGDREKLLDFNTAEHPLALQLGGSEPDELHKAARIGADWGYDEINLNVGCPSDRVQSGRFGACLMAEPERVRDCVAAARDAVATPVTVKTRIGIDALDHYEHLAHFIDTVASGGCETFIVHARKAWLSGLSPKENREIPPLDYPRVHRLKRDFPSLCIVINGGITTLDAASEQLRAVDGVMIGRAAYQTPYLLAHVDSTLFEHAAPPIGRKAAIRAFLPYIESQRQRGTRLSTLIRPLIGQFQGLPGARAWRRYLSENAHRPEAGLETIERAMAFVSDEMPPESVTPSTPPRASVHQLP